MAFLAVCVTDRWGDSRQSSSGPRPGVWGHGDRASSAPVGTAEPFLDGTRLRKEGVRVGDGGGSSSKSQASSDALGRRTATRGRASALFNNT